MEVLEESLRLPLSFPHLVSDRETRSVWDGRLPREREMSVCHTRDDGLVSQRHRHAGLLHLVEVRVLIADWPLLRLGLQC